MPILEIFINRIPICSISKIKIVVMASNQRKQYISIMGKETTYLEKYLKIKQQMTTTH